MWLRSVGLGGATLYAKSDGEEVNGFDKVGRASGPFA
jgi:hypothetical protein